VTDLSLFLNGGARSFASRSQTNNPFGAEATISSKAGDHQYFRLG